MNFDQYFSYHNILDSDSDFAKRLLEIIGEEGESVERDSEVAKSVYMKFLERFPNLEYWLDNFYAMVKKYVSLSLDRGYYVIRNEKYSYKQLVHQFLQENGYNPKNIVKDFIRKIAAYEDLHYDDYGEDPEDLWYKDTYGLYTDKKTYDVAIEDVLFSDDGLVTVTTKTGEKYRFYQADKYFPADSEIGLFIKENHGENLCHEYTERLQRFLPDAISVTAQLARNFGDHYYMHSYIELNESQVLDLTFNVVMNKEDYEKLMGPMKKCFVGRNKDLPQKIEEINALVSLDEIGGEDFQNIQYYNMLKLAAFEILKQRDSKLVELYESKLAGLQPS